MLETLQLYLFGSLILLILSVEALIILQVVLFFRTRRKNLKLEQELKDIFMKQNEGAVSFVKPPSKGN